MDTTEVTVRSPIRSLERAMRGPLGRKNVGVIAGPAGTGKTACLVQLGIDALLRTRRVLHVSAEAPIDHLRAWYEELFGELERSTGLANAQSVLLELERRRLLISLPGAPLRADRLHEAASLAVGTLGAEPDLILVEGFDFASADADALTALRELASRFDAELWLGARSHRRDKVTHPNGYPPPVDRHEASLDAIVVLDATDGKVRLRALKGHGAVLEGATLLLEPVTMQLIADGPEPASLHGRSRFTLHSGGAAGTEAAFGEMAERYGLAEVTFSFEGHTQRVRSRGLRILGDAELRAGDVSLRYVCHRLGRVFPEDPLVHKVLQSIWHQIRSCQQVFFVGAIQPDGTVRGGTGWGAELARRWKADLHVFDQERNGWFHWDGSAWQASTPVIRSPRFAGSGTRNLRPEGRRAIEELFERSFGSQA